MRNNPRTLVYIETGLPVHVGDIVGGSDDRCEVLAIMRHDSTVALREIDTNFAAEYYPGVIGAEWIERFRLLIR